MSITKCKAAAAEHLAEFYPNRRAALQAVRKSILANLDKGYAEGMSYGMIAYCVPHSVHPPGYQCKPEQALPFHALASQKNYMALYLTCLHGSREHEAWFRELGAGGESDAREGTGDREVSVRLLGVPAELVAHRGEQLGRVLVLAA